MKLGKKPGMVRRPIEYVLPAVIIVLVSTLVLSILALNDSSRDKGGDNKGIESISGSLDEIDQLTEEDIKAEIAVDEKYDEAEESAAGADGAAVEIGGIYNENDY